MFKIFSKRVISSIIFSVFFINLFSDYGVFGNELALVGYSLPASIGKVIDKFEVGKGEKVFLIEDLHCHPKVEENIEKILSWIKNNYGKDFNFIGLEGTKTEEINFDKFKKIDKKVLEDLGKELMELGLINGADFYAMKNKIKIYGIEEENIYLDSLKRLYKSILHRDRLENLRINLEKAYTRNERYFINDGVKDIFKKKEDSKKGKISFIDYVKFLRSKSNKVRYEELDRVLGLDEMEKSLDMAKVNLEVVYVMEKLGGYISKEEKETLNKSKEDKFYIILSEVLEENNIDISKNYKNLLAYINLLKARKMIDDLALIEELERLEKDAIRNELGDLGDGADFLSEMERMRLFFKYIKNEASPLDVEEYERGFKDFNIYSKKVFYRDYVADFSEDIKESSLNMEAFYKYASKRNEVMTNNLLNNKARSKVSAVLVGGYHAEGIKEFLRAKGIAYEVILPNLEDYDGKIFYEDRVKEEAKRLGFAEEEGNFKSLGKDKLNLIDVFSSAGIFSEEILNLEGKALEEKLISIINNRKNFDEVKEALKKYDVAKDILRKEAIERGKEKEFDKLEKELDANIAFGTKNSFFTGIINITKELFKYTGSLFSFVGVPMEFVKVNDKNEIEISKDDILEKETTNMKNYILYLQGIEGQVEELWQNRLPKDFEVIVIKGNMFNMGKSDKKYYITEAVYRFIDEMIKEYANTSYYYKGSLQERIIHKFLRHFKEHEDSEKEWFGRDKDKNNKDIKQSIKDAHHKAICFSVLANEEVSYKKKKELLFFIYKLPYYIYNQDRDTIVDAFKDFTESKSPLDVIIDCIDIEVDLACADEGLREEQKSLIKSTIAREFQKVFKLYDFDYNKCLYNLYTLLFHIIFVSRYIIKKQKNQILFASFLRNGKEEIFSIDSEKYSNIISNLEKCQKFLQDLQKKKETGKAEEEGKEKAEEEEEEKVEEEGKGKAEEEEEEKVEEEGKGKGFFGTIKSFFSCIRNNEEEKQNEFVYNNNNNEDEKEEFINNDENGNKKILSKEQEENIKVYLEKIEKFLKENKEVNTNNMQDFVELYGDIVQFANRIYAHLNDDSNHFYPQEIRFIDLSDLLNDGRGFEKNEKSIKNKSNINTNININNINNINDINYNNDNKNEIEGSESISIVLQNQDQNQNSNNQEGQKYLKEDKKDLKDREKLEKLVIPTIKDKNKNGKTPKLKLLYNSKENEIIENNNNNNNNTENNNIEKNNNNNTENNNKEKSNEENVSKNDNKKLEFYKINNNNNSSEEKEKNNKLQNNMLELNNNNNKSNEKEETYDTMDNGVFAIFFKFLQLCKKDEEENSGTGKQHLLTDFINVVKEREQSEERKVGATIITTGVIEFFDAFVSKKLISVEENGIKELNIMFINWINNQHLDYNCKTLLVFVRNYARQTPSELPFFRTINKNKKQDKDETFVFVEDTPLTLRIFGVFMLLYYEYKYKYLGSGKIDNFRSSYLDKFPKGKEKKGMLEFFNIEIDAIKNSNNLGDEEKKNRINFIGLVRAIFISNLSLDEVFKKLDELKENKEENKEYDYYFEYEHTDEEGFFHYEGKIEGTTLKEQKTETKINNENKGKIKGIKKEDVEKLLTIMQITKKNKDEHKSGKYKLMQLSGIEFHSQNSYVIDEAGIDYLDDKSILTNSFRKKRFYLKNFAYLCFDYYFNTFKKENFSLDYDKTDDKKILQRIKEEEELLEKNNNKDIKANIGILNIIKAILNRELTKFADIEEGLNLILNSFSDKNSASSEENIENNNIKSINNNSKKYIENNNNTNNSININLIEKNNNNKNEEKINIEYKITNNDHVKDAIETKNKENIDTNHIDLLNIIVDLFASIWIEKKVIKEAITLNDIDFTNKKLTDEGTKKTYENADNEKENNKEIILNLVQVLFECYCKKFTNITTNIESLYSMNKNELKEQIGKELDRKDLDRKDLDRKDQESFLYKYLKMLKNILQGDIKKGKQTKDTFEYIKKSIENSLKSSPSNFIGSGDLFDKGTKVSKDGGLIDKMRDLFKLFLDKSKILLESVSKKVGKVKELLKPNSIVMKKIGVKNLEIVESDEINLSSKEVDGKIRYRMSEKMALFLDMIMDGNKGEDTKGKLIEAFLHENIEILSKGDHGFALEYSGEFQKFLSNLFIDKEFKGHFDRLFNINQENKSITEKDIEEIMESVSYIVENFNKNSSGLRLSISDVYDKFPKIKENLIKDVVKKEELKEIVIDVNEKSLTEIKNILSKLGLENKYKLRIILVGDIKDKKDLEQYLDGLNNIKNPFIEVDAVLGKELLNELKKEESLLNKYKNIVSAVTVLGNGYILSAAGAIDIDLYNEIEKVLKEKNISLNEKNVARSINAGFFGEKDFKNIYEKFIKINDDENISINIRQFVIGLGKTLGDEKVLDKIINKVDDKAVKMITVLENGLVLSKSMDKTKFKDLSLMEENNIQDGISILGKEKIILEGLEGKNYDMLKFGITIKAKCIRFLSKIGLSKAIDREKLTLSENVRSFASAA